MVAEMASSQGNNGAKKIHGHGPTSKGRKANIATRQRLVIQAQGQMGSNQKSALAMATIFPHRP